MILQRHATECEFQQTSIEKGRSSDQLVVVCGRQYSPIFLSGSFIFTNSSEFVWRQVLLQFVGGKDATLIEIEFLVKTSS